MDDKGNIQAQREYGGMEALREVLFGPPLEDRKAREGRFWGILNTDIQKQDYLQLVLGEPGITYTTASGGKTKSKEKGAGWENAPQMQIKLYNKFHSAQISDAREKSKKMFEQYIDEHWEDFQRICKGENDLATYGSDVNWESMKKNAIRKVDDYYGALVVYDVLNEFKEKLGINNLEFQLNYKMGIGGSPEETAKRKDFDELGYQYAVWFFENKLNNLNK